MLGLKLHTWTMLSFEDEATYYLIITQLILINLQKKKKTKIKYKLLLKATAVILLVWPLNERINYLILIVNNNYCYYIYFKK